MMDNILNILYINIRGQTKLTFDKQLQIEDLARRNRSDIIHLQETEVDKNSFSQCHYLYNFFK